VSVVAAVLALSMLLTLPVTVSAHALRVSSSPDNGETLLRPPAVVTVVFGERPDSRLSAIHVLDALGRIQDAGPTTTVRGRDNALQVRLRPLPAGVYTVTWRTVSAVDGHVAAGAFTFGVGIAPVTGALPADLLSALPSALAIIGRALLYLGMVALFGMAVIAVAAFPEPPRRVLQLLPAPVVALAAGVATVAQAQRIEAGLSLGDFLGTSLTLGLLDRAVPTLVALTAVIATLRARTPARQRLGLVVIAVAAAAVMLADVDLSHATAGPFPRLNGAFQWLHALGVGVWMGGLAGLLAGIRGAPGPVKAVAVQRFSELAGGALVLVGLTGAIRAGVELGSWTAVTGSLFGRLVLVKVTLLAAIATLGAVNRFRNLPRVSHVLSGIRRVGSVELSLAVVTLAVAGTLVNVVPPASVSSPALRSEADLGTTSGVIDVSRVPGQPTLYTVHLSRGRELQVYLDPDRAGENRLHATFVDELGPKDPVRTAILSITPPDGATEFLSSHALGPGNFVASASLRDQTYQLEVDADTGSGKRLDAHLDITPSS
jgi:copper transport protein